MIILKNLSKAYGSRYLFKDISINFPSSGKIALVGNNGAGKTTMLNILCQYDKEYDGNIIKPKNLRLGYLPQVLNSNTEENILKEALTGAKEINHIIQERNLILEEMTQNYSQEIFEKYEIIEEKYNEHKCYMIEDNARDILLGLGFQENQFEMPVNILSGGWRIRLEFAKIFLNKPNFLILDEPTNHLDLPSIEWFENYLRKFNGTILFVSHDKGLLNRLADNVFHLRQGKLTHYPGNFDKFINAFTANQEQSAHSAKQIKLQYEHIEKFVKRFRASPSKARLVQSRLKSLAKLKALEGNIEHEDLDGDMQLTLNVQVKSGKTVLKADKVLIGYENKKPLTKEISLYITRGDRVAILGANGLGKSTLLKTMLGIHPPISGEMELGHNVSTGYFAQDCVESLKENMTVLENIRKIETSMKEVELRKILGSLGIGADDINKPVNVLSGGEKSRVALAIMLSGKPNTLFLDEPTNHLDLYACENFANALTEYEGTVIFVSHNRDFIEKVATHTLYLKDKTLPRFDKVHND